MSKQKKSAKVALVSVLTQFVFTATPPIIRTSCPRSPSPYPPMRHRTPLRHTPVPSGGKKRDYIASPHTPPLVLAKKSSSAMIGASGSYHSTPRSPPPSHMHDVDILESKSSHHGPYSVGSKRQSHLRGSGAVGDPIIIRGGPHSPPPSHHHSASSYSPQLKRRRTGGERSPAPSEKEYYSSSSHRRGGTGSERKTDYRGSSRSGHDYRGSGNDYNR